MTAVDRRPAGFSRSVSGFFGCLAFVASGFYSWPALLVGGVGLLILASGLVRAMRPAVTTGSFGLFFASVVAGTQGAPVGSVLASVVFVVVAWDVGANAISIGAQLGRSAETIRIEAVHATATLVVGVGTAGIGYGIYQLGTGGHPLAAITFLLLGAILLIGTLD